ncbi:MAG: condensation domain-containing protein, partial [Bacillota bacterium]
MGLYHNIADLILGRNDNKGITFIAGEYEEDYVSYKDLCRKALEFLYNLQAKGMQKGSELVFQIEDNREFICCFWACILGGIIPVPVAVGNNPEHRQKLFKIWETLKSPYLITDSKGARVLQKSVDDGISKDRIEEIINSTVLIEEIRNAAGTGIVYESSPEDTAFIQFSSGSTGDPKGVILTHRNLMTNIDAIISGSGTSPDDSALSWMPLTHDMGLIGFHISPAAAGINQYIMPTSLFIRHPVLWLKKAHEHKISLLSSPNFGYKYFLEFYKPESAKGWDLSNVRLIFNGAEPISVGLCRRFLKEMSVYGIKPNVMFNVYGMAEASLAVTFPSPGDDLASIMLDREFLFTGDSIREVNCGYGPKLVEFADLGYPVKGCSVRICDDSGRVLGENSVGNIEIKGENVTAGYYNNSEATLRTIKTDGWLNTGDLGFMKDGRLVVTGRAKDVIFVNGQNYYAHDIERVSEGVEGVELGRAAACSVFNSDSQRDDIILFVLFKKKPEDFVELAVGLKKQIFKQMALEVANVIPVKSIPKTTSGKIQRYKLGEMYRKGEFDPAIRKLEVLLSEYELSKCIDTPQNETEERLAGICREVLGVGRIGMNDNIFEQGGDSLKASILVSRIHKSFSVEISLEELIKLAAIRELAGYIKTAEKSVYSPVKPAAESPYYIVSPAQMRLFALDRVEDAGTSYNIPVVMIIEGSLEIPKLEEAFKALVIRHETLRTSFEVVDGQPAQRIHKQVDFSVETVCEITDSDKEARDNIEDKIDSAMEKFIKPFDLTKAPLIRVGLVKISKYRHILLLDMHHIISDGTSMGTLVKDFVSLYRGEKLQELRVQYKDYIQWRNDIFEKEALRRQEDYWLNRFSGEVPVLSLPLDFLRPSIRSFDGDRIGFSIDKDLKDKLKKLGAAKGASLYMVLLAAYNVLLSKYSDQEDIVVGSPAAGRRHPDVENTVGMFVNTLPLRNFPAGGKNFSLFLDQVRKDTLMAYENQDYQFDQLVEKLGIRRDMSRNPLFDTMFVLQNMEIPEFEIEGLKFINYEVKNKAAKFDITLEAVENQEGIRFNLEYCTRLFKRETIERLACHFEKILEQVAENPDIEISQIEMLTEEEKNQILFDFNNTKAGYPMDKTIPRVFEEQVERMPH